MIIISQPRFTLTQIVKQTIKGLLGKNSKRAIECLKSEYYLTDEAGMLLVIS